MQNGDSFAVAKKKLREKMDLGFRIEQRIQVFCIIIIILCLCLYMYTYSCRERNKVCGLAERERGKVDEGCGNLQIFNLINKFGNYFFIFLSLTSIYKIPKK